MLNRNRTRPCINRPIFITGCSSGIGLAAANYLKSLGYRVITSCRKSSDVARLQELGFECVALDLDDSASVEQAAAEVLTLCNGQLYGLFNNAGFGIYGPVQTITRQQMEQQFATNLFGLHQLTLLLLPAMLKHGEGRIIQTSSVMGIISSPGRGVYAASKYALEAWSDALRLELHGTGIKVCLIEPGPIKTNFSQNVNQTLLEQPVTNPGVVKRFALGPEAILPKLQHALSSPNPKVRYRVTLVTHVAALLKRLLPDRCMDRVLRSKS